MSTGSALPLEEVQGTHMEHLGTPSSPWSDQEDEDYIHRVP